MSSIFPMASSTSTQGASSSFSFSSSSTFQGKYDVFLSFRGIDTRKSFTNHLYTALQRKGILTFRDDEELKRGKYISPELSKAIEESRFAIIILSRNYASSTWCLVELTKIIKCMKEMGMKVLPVFYDVDPSDVRKQTGTFEKAFIDHEECFKENIDLVKTWRAALTEVTNLSGWHLQDRHELEFIQHIVEVILHKLSSSFSSITTNLVGIDSSMEELITSYLGLGNNVCMIGICGMGGLGKTTLARVVFDRFSNHFEGSSFIINVREVSEKGGLVPLQQQLIEEVLENRNTKIRNVYHGIDMIKKRLCNKKVLIVLDDVNQLDQLEKLVGDHGWFGLGSWIIITTRDEHLLVQHGIHKIYKPNVLNDRDALKLFCLKAFKKEQPREGYMQLSHNVAYHAKGLPLALVTLGSFLVGRTMGDWQSALDNFKKNPKREIFDILRISYDGLEEMWKEIFLDIACFFRGKTKDRVIEILENCGFDARIGISVLMDKSLLTIENNKLWMHDLLQEMGREIVRLESRGEPGKRSRLWLRKDLFHVLKKDTATEAIQTIVINSYECEGGYRNFEAFPEGFSKMHNLRLLIIDDVHILNGLDHVSNDLRFLQWIGYSSKCLPSSFQPKELFELNLQCSKLKYLWEGIKYLDRLKSIDLSYSTNLIQTPDFTGVSTLERLYLTGCTNLVEIHSSMGQLSRLIVLDLENCESLINLPSMSAEMQSLRILNLLGCESLMNLSEFKGIMKSLSELYLGKTAIDKLPSSIECLTALTLLNLKDWLNLKCLPNNMDSLMSLEKLVLSGCLKLANLPQNLWKIKCLKELDLSGTGISEVPSSIGCTEPLESNFCVEQLNLSGMSRLEGIGINSFGCFSSLKYLTLSRNSFVTLPASISQLSKLEALDLCLCSNLRSLPELPLTVRYINAQECSSLEPSPALLRLRNLARPSSHLYGYDESSGGVAFTILNRYLQGLLYTKMGYETSTKRKDDGSGTEFQIVIPGFYIPRWFTHRRLGNSVRIELPPNWCNSRWMGFALCALFDAFFPLNDFISASVDKTFGIRAHVIALGGDMPHRHYSSDIFFRLTSGSCHIWLLYLSRDSWFATVGNGECNQIEVTFENYGPRLNVWNCGVNLVYEQDVEETLTKQLHNATVATSLLERVRMGMVSMNLTIT